MAVPAYLHSFTIKDGKGKRSVAQLSSNHGTYALALVASNDLRNALDPVILGTIEKHTITTVVTTSATAPAVNSDVEETARFTFRDASNFAVQFTAPTLDETFVIAGTSQIDLENVAIADLVNVIVDGGFTSIHADDIVALEKAVEAFRS